MKNDFSPAALNPSFKRCEQGIRQIYEVLPDLPYQEVVLTRLYYHVQGFLNDYFNASLHHFGLNVSSWATLMLLYTSPDKAMYPSELSQALSFSRTNATRVVNDLVNEHWIERRPCSDDGRKTRLILTEQGCDFVVRVLPERNCQQQKLWSGFSDVEKSAMEGLLRKLLAHLGG